MTDDSGDLAVLGGTAWRATRFGAELAEVASSDQEFTFEVQGDRLAGRSGCNRYMGTWAVEDGALRIGPLATTMMYCDGLMELERSFLDALQAVHAMRRDAERLVLTDERGGALIELVAAEPVA